MKQEKQWWAPLWKGLIMDNSATHYLCMKSALWLFLYLVLNASRTTGTLTRKVHTICLDTGIERDTILRWLRVLRERGYIETKNTGRFLSIQVTKWKPSREVGNRPPQKWEKSNTRSGILPTSDQRKNSSRVAQLKQNFGRNAAPNEISITRALLKIDIDSKKKFLNRIHSQSGSTPMTREELLAQDLADGLSDQAGRSLYLAYAHKYPESLLRQMLSTIKQMPEKNIRKSRGALFNYLIQKHAAKTNDRVSH